MAIEKLSEGNPSALAIGLYGEELNGFDAIVATKLLDELKKLVGVWHIHPCETDYENMPDVDFVISTGPPSRSRMLGETEDFRKYDSEVSFEQAAKDHARVARIILQEFPWGASKGALNFSFGPSWGTLTLPIWRPEWGKGWFKYKDVYWLYPFADKQESRPEKKEDFVFVKYSTSQAEQDKGSDFSVPLIEALEELGVEYFQGKYSPKERIPHEEFISKMNLAKLYFQIKAESYGLTKFEAVASETAVIGTNRTIKRLYANEFNFHRIQGSGRHSVETLKQVIMDQLAAYDRPEMKEQLHMAREKLWTYKRLAREIASILKVLKKEKLSKETVG